MNYPQSWNHILWLINTNYNPTILVTALPVLHVDHCVVHDIFNNYGDIFFSLRINVKMFYISFYNICYINYI